MSCAHTTEIDANIWYVSPITHLVVGTIFRRRLRLRWRFGQGSSTSNIDNHRQGFESILHSSIRPHPSLDFIIKSFRSARDRQTAPSLHIAMPSSFPPPSARHNSRRSNSGNQRSQDVRHQPFAGQEHPQHSFWSALRKHCIAMLSEFIGTVMFLWFAFAATQASVQVSQDMSPARLLFISFSFGFSLLVSAWVHYRVSGGLFNPCVSHIFSSSASGLIIAGYLGNGYYTKYAMAERSDASAGSDSWWHCCCSSRRMYASWSKCNGHKSGFGNINHPRTVHRSLWNSNAGFHYLDDGCWKAWSDTICTTCYWICSVRHWIGYSVVYRGSCQSSQSFRTKRCSKVISWLSLDLLVSCWLCIEISWQKQGWVQRLDRCSLQDIINSVGLWSIGKSILGRMLNVVDVIWCVSCC